MLNPFSITDLLKAHGTMMFALSDDAGRFRQGSVGVFSEKGLVHMAPPANRVQGLIEDLMQWLASSDDHLLIRSCVFHYEFEFIHPFSDGNGRMGRLWQSLILGKLHPLFEHLPVENTVYSNQQAYYDAISQSTCKGECSHFIEFMLGEILTTLKTHQGNEIDVNVGRNVGRNYDLAESEHQVLELIIENNRLTIKEVALLLSISQRQAERLFASLKSISLR